MNTEQEYKDFGKDQVTKCLEGFGLDCLVVFEHKGKIIINPYAHSYNPDELFGVMQMAEWRHEAARLIAEWKADAESKRQ